MQISSYSPLQTTAFSQLRSNQETGNKTGVLIEITPGTDNVKSGDRSSNVAEVSVTTPNTSFSTEVSRDQVVNAVEHKIQKNIAQQLTGSNNRASNPLLIAAVKSDNMDTKQLNDLGTAIYQNRLAKTYINAYQNNSNSIYTPSPLYVNSSNPTKSPSNAGVGLANQAVDVYIKQTLFFSGVDQIKSTFSATA